MKIGTPDGGYLTNEGDGDPDYSLPPGVDIDSDEAERAMCDCGEYGGLLHRPNCNWVTQRMNVVAPMSEASLPPGVHIESDEAERSMCDCGEYGKGVLHRPNCNWVTQRTKAITSMPAQDEKDPTTRAANPSHYQGFSNGAQPAFICEHLTWNSGQAVRYLSRGDSKPEQGLTAEQTYVQNLKKALWHIKRELMLHGENPEDVRVPDPRSCAQPPLGR